MSRWFQVTADRFDWMPTPRSMITFKRGEIGYRPQACIDAGLSIGAIKLIKPPKGARIGKDGRVVIGEP